MTREEAKRIATGLRTDFKCESDTMVDFCNTVIKALEQEPCEDVISRKEVSDWLNNKLPYTKQEAEDIANFYNFIDNLPSVTPVRPKGHWIKFHPLQVDDEGAYMCSCCKVGDWGLKGTENFCPTCGAKMVEPQESEE